MTACSTYTNGILTSAISINPQFGGNDMISLGAGNNIVVGGFGNNTITAGAGNQIIVGNNGYGAGQRYGCVAGGRVHRPAIRWRQHDHRGRWQRPDHRRDRQQHHHCRQRQQRCHIAAAINKKFPNQASAENSALVTVRSRTIIPHHTIEFIAELEKISVDADQLAKVVINERTGTIVMGKDIRIKPAAILHGNLTVQVETTFASSSAGFSTPIEWSCNAGASIDDWKTRRDTCYQDVREG